MHASLSAPRSATVIGGSTHSVPHAPYSLVPHPASAMSVSPTRLVYTADLRMRAPHMDQSLEIGAIASPASVWTLVQPLSVASAAALPLPSQLVALPCDASGAGLREAAAKRSVVSQPSDSDSVYSYASGAMDDGAAAHDIVSRVSLVDTALARDGTPDVTSVTGAADRRGVPAAFALDCAAAVAAGATTAAAAPARVTQPPFVTAGDNAPAQLAAGGSVSSRSRPRRTHLHIDVGGASRSSSSSARSDAGFTPDADKQCSHTWPSGNSLHLVGDDDASSRASGTPGSDARARSVHTPSTASSEHTTTPVAPLRLHVLIVEDEDLIRKILCRILTKLGCTYVAVEDGVHVLPLLRAPGNHFDAILMDVVMPYMRGDECLAQ
ncbi:response regulator, partial [archaeon]